MSGGPIGARLTLVYENWCMQCQGEEIKRIEEEGLEEEEKKRRIEKIRLHKYVGETARCTHERAWEHQQALKTLNIKSFMQKHVLDTDMR